MKKKYIVYLGIAVAICIALVAWVIGHNGDADDGLYVMDSICVGLATNIIGSILIMIFFDARDKKAVRRREFSAANKVAAEINHFRRGDMSEPDLVKRLRYLRDLLHGDLGEELLGELDRFTETGSEISRREVIATLKDKYDISLAKK